MGNVDGPKDTFTVVLDETAITQAHASIGRRGEERAAKLRPRRRRRKRSRPR
jgi:hypothetical protein